MAEYVKRAWWVEVLIGVGQGVALEFLIILAFRYLTVYLWAIVEPSEGALTGVGIGTMLLVACLPIVNLLRRKWVIAAGNFLGIFSFFVVRLLWVVLSSD